MVCQRGKRWKISGTALGLLGCVVTGCLLEREEMILWLGFLPAVFVHEAGHLLVARWCGVKVDGMKLDLLGARISLDGMVSYGHEFLVAFGGPLANFLCSFALYMALGKEVWLLQDMLSSFFVSSVTLGAFNLLPVGTMDGGRMLAACLSGWVNPRVSYVCLRMTTALFLLALWLFSAYALLMGAGMLSVFVFALCLLLRLLSSDPSAEV